jgi:single-strand DNA-binding protein
MASFNRVILMGNLTRDVELKHLPSGNTVAEVGLAVNDKRKNAQGEWVEEVTFVDVTLWGRTAEIASEYLSKGSPIFIEGRLKLDTWEKDGKKNYKLRVVAENMRMVGGRGDRGGGGGGGGSGGGSRSYDESEAPGSYSDDDAPRSAPPQRGSGPAPAQPEDIPF